jgi:RecG-like helicase
LEKAEHPLHRIMDIQETNDGFVVTTTDIHLPRRIGEALHRAYHGTLDFHYDDEAYLLRVNWTRDQ